MFGKRKKVRPTTKLSDILESPDKDISKVRGFDGVLTMLLRKIMFDLNISGEFFNQLIESFIRTSSKRLMPRNDASSIKGNLTKDFVKDRITWRGIMKALLVLRVSGFDLQITLRYFDRPGMKTTHGVSVDLSPFYDKDQTFDTKNIYNDERIETIIEKLSRIELQISQTATDMNKSVKQSKEQ